MCCFSYFQMAREKTVSQHSAGTTEHPHQSIEETIHFSLSGIILLHVSWPCRTQCHGVAGTSPYTRDYMDKLVHLLIPAIPYPCSMEHGPICFHLPTASCQGMRCITSISTIQTGDSMTPVLVQKVRAEKIGKKYSCWRVVTWAPKEVQSQMLWSVDTVNLCHLVSQKGPLSYFRYRCIWAGPRLPLGKEHLVAVSAHESIAQCTIFLSLLCDGRLKGEPLILAWPCITGRSEQWL